MYMSEHGEPNSGLGILPPKKSPVTLGLQTNCSDSVGQRVKILLRSRASLVGSYSFLVGSAKTPLFDTPINRKLVRTRIEVGIRSGTPMATLDYFYGHKSNPNVLAQLPSPLNKLALYGCGSHYSCGLYSRSILGSGTVHVSPHQILGNAAQGNPGSHTACWTSNHSGAFRKCEPNIDRDSHGIMSLGFRQIRVTICFLQSNPLLIDVASF